MVKTGFRLVRVSNKPPKKRPSRAKPVPGFTGAEVERLTAVKKRCLANWVKEGLVPAPVFRGRGTRYTRAQLARILMVKKLRGDFLPVGAVKKTLARLTEVEIEARVELAKLLGETPAPSGAGGGVALSGEPSAAPPAGPQAERWQRLELVPGLEVHARQEPALIDLANEIFRQFIASRQRR